MALQRRQSVIYDVLYGFVPITDWEQEIINSPFFQRLRWIRQLGFANYIFPGAEHNRFAHAIGVMHSMDSMIRALGLAVSDRELFSRSSRQPAALLHKSLRIAALLHDIGTFPFSHASEYAYIRHGNDKRRASRGPAKALPNSHEHLGSFIIKNTRFKGGITEILERYGFDVGDISKMIKGESPHLIANQLVHSDLDADRMDYLIRDSHYTGLQYGKFDRDYLLKSLATYDAGQGQTGYGVREGAMHAVEDFLIARFSWYSQIIRNSEGAKFDVLCTAVTTACLESDQMVQFHDLLEMVEKKDERFFWWNDMYFMQRAQDLRAKGIFRGTPVDEWIQMLLYREAPKTLLNPLFRHRILPVRADRSERERLNEQINKYVRKLNRVLSDFGDGSEWILADIPEKDVVFATDLLRLVKGRTQVNLYREPDPIKIITRDGRPKLLVEMDHSLIRYLAGLFNFVPNVYGNKAAHALLLKKKLIQ